MKKNWNMFKSNVDHFKVSVFMSGNEITPSKLYQRSYSSSFFYSCTQATLQVPLADVIIITVSDTLCLPSQFCGVIKKYIYSHHILKCCILFEHPVGSHFGDVLGEKSHTRF